MNFVAALISVHTRWDIILWLVFFAGQCLYILKRAAMAIRSKTNPIKSRRAFLYANWDILLFRTAIEFIFPFSLVRHVTIGTAASFFHIVLPSWIPANGQMPALGFLALGVCADVLLDWVGQNDKVPTFIRQFIQEQIPSVPVVQDVLKS